MDLAKALKNLKLNESKISSILGGLIILVVAIMVVNYFRNLKPGDTSLPATQTEATPSTQTIHTVERGESLWSIAVDYYGDGYKWTEIRDANDLSNSDDVKVGQEIIVPEIETESPIAQASSTPTVQTATPEASSIASATPQSTIKPIATPDTQKPSDEASAGQIQGDSYTVVHGDTLWDIAQRAYGDPYKWTEIASANHLVNPNLIHAGNHFVIPR